MEDNFSMDGAWGEEGSGGNASDGEGRRGFAHSLAAHLLLCSPVPNGPWTSIGLPPGGWGPLP